MTPFIEWKNLPPVRESIAALIDIDLDAVQGWDAYKHAVSVADRSQIRVRSERLSTRLSPTQKVVTAAVLSTLDYPDLSGELLQGANIFALARRFDREQRGAVAGAISAGR